MNCVFFFTYHYLWLSLIVYDYLCIHLLIHQFVHSFFMLDAGTTRLRASWTTVQRCPGSGWRRSPVKSETRWNRGDSDQQMLIETLKYGDWWWCIHMYYICIINVYIYIHNHLTCWFNPPDLVICHEWWFHHRNDGTEVDMPSSIRRVWLEKICKI